MHLLMKRLISFHSLSLFFFHSLMRNMLPQGTIVDTKKLVVTLRYHRWVVVSVLVLIFSIPLLIKSNFSDNIRWTHKEIRRISWSWIAVEFDSNYTSKLQSEMQKKVNGTDPCRNSRTTSISIVGLDKMVRDPTVKFVAGEVYEFVIVTRDKNGRRQSCGGDYFETDLSSENWKSRPPVKDHGNGNYSISFQIHPDFAGKFNLTVYLLFRSFEGFEFPPYPFVYDKLMRKVLIVFQNNNISILPTLPLCQLKDFNREVWTGRWTRNVWNDECNISPYDGRYRCIDPSTQCVSPWCQGQVGLLESNGWVYSAHCSFHMYTQDEAWKCLNGKYLFFWGDSNHVDTIRNLLNFVLGRWEVKSVPRRFYNMTYVNPRKSTESVRITSIFNGHHVESGNHLGLDSLLNEDYRNLIKGYFTGDDTPDVMILNSGLHDGKRGFNVSEYIKAVDYALDFWLETLQGLTAEKKKNSYPSIFYRTTVAAGSSARRLSVNPQKMEAFNSIMVENIRRKGLFLNSSVSGFIDDFDITFPFHYDFRYSDGFHYGKEPTTNNWTDGKIGHHYFVDLMLVHVLLNSICHDHHQQW